MCACCGLYGERIEYCGPLVRAGTQYNATTCPARAGLIRDPAIPRRLRCYLSRTRGVDPTTRQQLTKEMNLSRTRGVDPADDEILTTDETPVPHARG